MFEIFLVVYLWLIGAWGHYDLYTSTPAWQPADQTAKTEWVVVMCCIGWPLIIPFVMLIEFSHWLSEKFDGAH